MRLYDKYFTDFKELYMAHTALAIIASSCIGSIAAMLVLMSGYDVLQMVQLFIVVAVTMGFNATVLAQLPPKIVFDSLLVSLGVNSLFVTGHIMLLLLA